MAIYRPVPVALLRSYPEFIWVLREYNYLGASTITIAQLCESIKRRYLCNENSDDDDEYFSPENVKQRRRFYIACETLGLLDEKTEQFIALRSSKIEEKIKNGENLASLPYGDIVDFTFRGVIRKLIELQSQSGDD